MIRFRGTVTKYRPHIIDVKEKKLQTAKGSLHATLRRTLLIFRGLGLFPVNGLTKDTGDGIRFLWMSLPTFRFSLCFAGVAILNILIFNEVYNNGVHYTQIAVILIVGSSVWTITVMFKMSRNWRQVLIEADKLLQTVPISEGNSNRYCSIASIGLLFVGITDYALYTVHSIRSTYACNQHLNPFYAYYTKYHTWIFNHIEFNYYLGAIYQFTELHTVFILYFKDIIVVACSIYASELFARLNDIIFEEKNRPPWKELRMHYTKLSQLVKLLDKQISSLVFLSHLCNMYYICHELFQIFHNAYSQRVKSCYLGYADLKIEDVFFHGYALACMIMRALLATLIPARVHTVSRKPLEILNTLKSSDYNVDVQSFMDQVYYSQVGFTGLGFFFVTKGLLLSVIGTVTTYELVLLQFFDK